MFDGFSSHLISGRPRSHIKRLGKIEKTSDHTYKQTHLPFVSAKVCKLKSKFQTHVESINVLQRRMLRFIDGWVRMNGEDWSEMMPPMKHRINVALNFFPMPLWTEQLATRQFQCAAKVAAQQSWSSMAGRWAVTPGRHSNFDMIPSRRRGRPLIKWLFPTAPWMACGGETAIMGKCAEVLRFTFCGPSGSYIPLVLMASKSWCFTLTRAGAMQKKSFENNHVHNRGTATRPHHNASWTHHCCKGQFWNT